jgi:hypothetical protein
VQADRGSKGAAVEGSVSDVGLRAARKLVEAKDDEWPAYVDRLRRNKELSAVTHQLNQMLEQQEHRQLAIDAFRRIGLWHDDFDMPRRMADREFGGQLESEVRGVDVTSQVRLKDEMSHLLEMDEPMAFAGAQLSGLHVKSETEAALERATRDEGQQRPDVPVTKQFWFRLAIVVLLAIFALLVVRMHGAAA